MGGGSSLGALQKFTPMADDATITDIMGSCSFCYVKFRLGIVSLTKRLNDESFKHVHL